jgi:hypothetical protein
MKQSTKVTVRTVIQAVLMTAVMLPGVVQASGIPETLPWVAGGLAVAAAATRIMALPRVQDLLDRLGLATDAPAAAATLRVAETDERPRIILSLTGPLSAHDVEQLARTVRDLARLGGGETGPRS